MRDRVGGPLRASVARVDRRQITTAGLFNLAIVYVVWGSTFLAIRVAVRPGAGFDPFIMGLMRALVAGPLLLLWAALRRGMIRPSRVEFGVLALSGLLIWTGGNGLLVVAERRMDSNLAALIVASTPMWAAAVEAYFDRRLPTWRSVVSLLIGFLGIVFLGVPALQAGVRADLMAFLMVVLSSVSWALGSVIQSKTPIRLSPSASAGYQQLFGGLGFVFLTLVAQEPIPTPSSEAWLAWGYLIVFGSFLAFTAYVKVLQWLPTSVAMTHTFVNPVIAVILGALVLDEGITLWTMLGAACVLTGVAGVFRYRA